MSSIFRQFLKSYPIPTRMKANTSKVVEMVITATQTIWEMDTYFGALFGWDMHEKLYIIFQKIFLWLNPWSIIVTFHVNDVKIP